MPWMYWEVAHLKQLYINVMYLYIYLFMMSKNTKDVIYTATLPVEI